MNRRLERVGRLIQQTIAEILLDEVNDPRIPPARVSITRVEVVEDLTRAKVFVSVMDDEPGQRTALRALRHAAGRIQEEMMSRISLRATPVLDFVEDVQFKKSLTTLALIQEAMTELHEREQAAAEAGQEPPAEAEPDTAQ